MKHEITIRNGSGWNHYKALGELKSLPRGTRGMMKENGCAEIRIEPHDSERPFGIAAKLYDEAGDQMFLLRFDQNEEARWIADRVVNLLQEGIDVRIKKRGVEIAARELKAANDAGFPDAASHRAHVNEVNAAERAAKTAKRMATLNDPVRAARAESTLMSLLPITRTHPAPDGYEWRLDRSGWLGCYKIGAGLLVPDHPETGSLERDDINAWLYQHGDHHSIDSRHKLLDFCLAKL